MTPAYSSRDEYKIATAPRKERKLEEFFTSVEFSGQEVLGSTPLTEEVIMNLNLPCQEEQGTTVTPMYSSRDEYKITTTPRKERKPEEAAATFECSGRIELTSTSTLTSEEGIPIIKE